MVKPGAGGGSDGYQQMQLVEQQVSFRPRWPPGRPATALTRACAG